MEIYLKWLDDLISAIRQDKIVKNHPCLIIKCLLENKEPEEISIQVIHDVQPEKNLIIDSTSFRKYFEAVVEPRYTYEESINDSSKACVKYIKEWLEY